MDSGRADMPSAFLTRLRLGDRFVDASAVAALHRQPARTWPLWLLMLVLLAGLVATVVARSRRHAAGRPAAERGGHRERPPRPDAAAVTGVRHLLLATVAAVLALALGLALGAGPVVSRSDATRASRDDRLAARTARLEARLARLRGRRAHRCPGGWPRWPAR